MCRVGGDGLIDMNPVLTARPHTYAVRSGGTFAYSSLGLDRWVIRGVFLEVQIAQIQE